MHEYLSVDIVWETDGGSYFALGLASVSRESCENLLSRGGVDGEGMGRAITIVVGGVIPQQDYDFLYNNGADFIFGPGTNLPKSAC